MKKGFMILIGLVLVLAAHTVPAFTESAVPSPMESAVPAPLESAGTVLAVKLNFFGPSAAAGGSGVATALHFSSLVQKNVQVEFKAENLLAELKKTFNASDVDLLASADLSWRAGGPAAVSQVVRIDGRDYIVVLTPRPKTGAVTFKVGGVEEGDAEKIKKVLLDSEIVLPDGEVAILGFRDTRERSFFIAFYVQGRDEAFGKGAVRLAGADRPKLIKKVNPVYPKAALAEKLQGVVVLEGLIDEGGKVADVRVISSAAPALDQAAVEALRGWEYEPFQVAGKAKKVVFSVTITFALDAGREKEEPKEGRGGPGQLLDSPEPRVLKQVSPAYPEEAKKNRLQGTVVLEVRTSEEGKVRAIRVLQSAAPLLDQAALEAVKQWEYEPVLKDGRAVPLTFNVTVRFALK